MNLANLTSTDGCCTRAYFTVINPALQMPEVYLAGVLEADALRVLDCAIYRKSSAGLMASQRAVMVEDVQPLSLVAQL